MNPKEFLLEECRNIRATLLDVLRHDYAAGSSEEFYNEFCERINFLESLISPVALEDTSALSSFADEASLLSTLVHHMERSHAGEFPWPFTEFLLTLAKPLCTERLLENEKQPIIRVYAEGGLYSYQINLENDLSKLSVGRRIFTIVFPRTLRHHVLLHSIFGHEIGHAAWTIPVHRGELRDRVLSPLRDSGRLTSISSATEWLRDANAPSAIADLRDQLGDRSFTDVSRNQLDSWFQEFMCDLFGLVTFGPSFLAAHKTLLMALDPTGHKWGPNHPPYVCRRAMLWQACEHLQWTKFASKMKDKSLQTQTRNFLRQTLGNKPGPWEDVFTGKQVQIAVDALTGLLENAGIHCHRMPDEATLRSLVRMLEQDIPPCGADLSGSEEFSNRILDFRDILFAGWIVADYASIGEHNGRRQIEFVQLNKLCEMGLLQQHAINQHKSQ